MSRGILLVIVALAVLSCNKEDKVFRSVSEQVSGVAFTNQLNPTVEFNILTYLYYYNGAGVAAADFNNDGLEDLYFVSNEGADQLYLNKGDFTFDEITTSAGIKNDFGWSFGVTAADVNADGLIDIYISKVGKYRGISGRNLLFINKGLDKDGMPLFVEAAADYGLDIVSLCTQTVFFDFDLDGDLDAYVLNHSVHPNSNYGLGKTRDRIDSLAGDMLLRNDDGFFVDVSAVSGIHQGSIGYGLDLSIGDLNGDRYPDIYVGNDFFENDYLYINQGDGTFRDVHDEVTSPVGHTTHFSMGNAFADLNNDGYQDIVSLDMLPQDLASYKASGTEYSYSIYRQYLQNGYAPQYMQNTIHLNYGRRFAEVGFQFGVPATEWSWSVLANDFDMDGFRDLYISNGIPAATNDMDYVKFASEEVIQKQLKNPSEENFELVERIPSKYVQNYAFKNSKTDFEDVSSEWFDNQNSYSSGAVAVDLDNDGDLDIVTSNLNESPFLFENQSASDTTNYLKITYQGPDKNRFGIGARLEIYAGSLFVSAENFPNKTYLSSSPQHHTIGLGKNAKVDSLFVTWPDGSYQKINDIQANQAITLIYSEAEDLAAESRNLSLGQKFLNAESLIDFTHLDQVSVDFDREGLIPFAKSNEGPSISIGDIDNNGHDDIFIGGGKGQSSSILLSRADGFHGPSTWQLNEEAIKEVTASHLFDADMDGDLDLVLGFGGNEFVDGAALQLELYLNSNNGWTRSAAIDIVDIHASVIKSIDLESDGDLDLIIGANTVTGEFGKSAQNYVLKNEKGAFRNVTATIAWEFADYGLVEDFEILDFDHNGLDDIVVVGYWAPITIFLNDGKTLSPKIVLNDTEGWWNTLEVADFDKDGDLDIVAGNWGLNTRLRSSKEEPVTLYRYDFDSNGKVDPIVSYFYAGEETTIASKDELVKQLPHLNKKYLSYRSFAEAPFEEVFGIKNLQEASKKRVYMLSSTYFENKENGIFVPHLLPFEAQSSTVHDILLDDMNEDGFLDMVLVGNSFELSTQIGRLDALGGLVLLNEQNGSFRTDEHLNIIGAARELETMIFNGEEFLVVGLNNAKPVFLKKSKK